MTRKQMVTLRESGYQYQVDADELLAELAQHGDDPRQYSTDLNDFTFYGSDEDVPADWPDHLPTWSYTRR